MNVLKTLESRFVSIIIIFFVCSFGCPSVNYFLMRRKYDLIPFSSLLLCAVLYYFHGELLVFFYFHRAHTHTHSSNGIHTTLREEIVLLLLLLLYVVNKNLYTQQQHNADPSSRCRSRHRLSL